MFVICLYLIEDVCNNVIGLVKFVKVFNVFIILIIVVEKLFSGLFFLELRVVFFD